MDAVLPLLYHEATTDGIVRSRGCRAIFKQGLKRDRIGMKGQALGIQEQQVFLISKRDFMDTAQHQALFLLDPGRFYRYLTDIHGCRVIAAEPKEDSHVRAVPHARLGKRPVKQDLDSFGMPERSGCLQIACEPLGGTPGTERVGTGRADAYLEHVENGNLLFYHKDLWRFCKVIAFRGIFSEAAFFLSLPRTMALEMRYIRACLTFLTVFSGSLMHVTAYGRPDPPAEILPKRELRGVWIATVVNIDWPSAAGLSAEQQKRELIQQLDNHQRAGINAVMLQIRPTADAFYAKSREPWSRFLTGKP